jgi:hypothetical protein
MSLVIETLFQKETTQLRIDTNCLLRNWWLKIQKNSIYRIVSSLRNPVVYTIVSKWLNEWHCTHQSDSIILLESQIHSNIHSNLRFNNLLVSNLIWDLKKKTHVLTDASDCHFYYCSVINLFSSIYFQLHTKLTS